MQLGLRGNAESVPGDTGACVGIDADVGNQAKSVAEPGVAPLARVLLYSPRWHGLVLGVVCERRG